MKPQMILNLRISEDFSNKPKFTEEEIKTEFKNNNVIVYNKHILRKHDSAVMGEILISLKLWN